MVAPAAATRMMGTAISAKERRWFETAMPPSSVAPVVAFLAPSACFFSGELLGVGGGVVNRLFVGETQGYLDRDLTIESVHEHIDGIFDAKGYEPLASTAEAAAKRRALDRAGDEPGGGLAGRLERHGEKYRCPLGRSDRPFGDNSPFFGERRYFYMWTGSRGRPTGRHVVIGTHGSHDQFLWERPK